MKRKYISKSFIAKIALVLVIILLFELVASRPVQASAVELGGTLLTPIVNLIVFLADGIIEILQSALMGIEESYHQFDLNNTGTVLTTVLLIGAAIILAACIAVAAVYVAPAIAAAAAAGTTVSIKITMLSKGLIAIGKLAGGTAIIVAAFFPQIEAISQAAFGETFVYSSIVLAPETILKNQIGFFDINFMDFNTTGVNSEDATVAETLGAIVGQVYTSLRDIAFIAMAIVLVYIGIKTLISINPREKNKWMGNLTNCIGGMAIIVLMHFIISVSIDGVNAITQAIAAPTYGIEVSESELESKVAEVSDKLENDEEFQKNHTQGAAITIKGKEVYDCITGANLDKGDNVTAENESKWWRPFDGDEKYVTINTTTFTEQLRYRAQMKYEVPTTVEVEDDPDTPEDETKYKYDDENKYTTWEHIGWSIAYVMMVVITLGFVWLYGKRVVYIAVLMMFAPIVGIMFALNKLNGGRAVSLGLWIKEFFSVLIMQPMHLFLYTILVGSAMTMAINNPLYVIIALMGILFVEKFVKDLIGLGDSRVGGLKEALNTTNGALSKASDAMRSVAKKAVSTVGNIGETVGGMAVGAAVESGKTGRASVRMNDNTLTGGTNANTAGNPNLDEGIERVEGEVVDTRYRPNMQSGALGLPDLEENVVAESPYVEVDDHGGVDDDYGAQMLGLPMNNEVEDAGVAKEVPGEGQPDFFDEENQRLLDEENEYEMVATAGNETYGLPYDEDNDMSGELNAERNNGEVLLDDDGNELMTPNGEPLYGLPYDENNAMSGALSTEERYMGNTEGNNEEIVLDENGNPMSTPTGKPLYGLPDKQAETANMGANKHLTDDTMQMLRDENKIVPIDGRVPKEARQNVNNGGQAEIIRFQGRNPNGMPPTTPGGAIDPAALKRPAVQANYKTNSQGTFVSTPAIKGKEVAQMDGQIVANSNNVRTAMGSQIYKNGTKSNVGPSFGENALKMAAGAENMTATIAKTNMKVGGATGANGGEPAGTRTYSSGGSYNGSKANIKENNTNITSVEGGQAKVSNNVERQEVMTLNSSGNVKSPENIVTTEATLSKEDIRNNIEIADGGFLQQEVIEMVNSGETSTGTTIEAVDGGLMQSQINETITKGETATTIEMVDGGVTQPQVNETITKGETSTTIEMVDEGLAQPQIIETLTTDNTATGTTIEVMDNGLTQSQVYQADTRTETTYSEITTDSRTSEGTARKLTREDFTVYDGGKANNIVENQLGDIDKNANVQTVSRNIEYTTDSKETNTFQSPATMRSETVGKDIEYTTDSRETTTFQPPATMSSGTVSRPINRSGKHSTERTTQETIQIPTETRVSSTNNVTPSNEPTQTEQKVKVKNQIDAGEILMRTDKTVKAAANTAYNVGDAVYDGLVKGILNASGGNIEGAATTVANAGERVIEETITGTQDIVGAVLGEEPVRRRKEAPKAEKRIEKKTEKSSSGSTGSADAEYVMKQTRRMTKEEAEMLVRKVRAEYPNDRKWSKEQIAHMAVFQEKSGYNEGQLKEVIKDIIGVKRGHNSEQQAKSILQRKYGTGQDFNEVWDLYKKI